MLFIYWALSIGGIETFFVRMAKARSRLGKTTRVLLVGPREASNLHLLNEIQKFAEVVFLEDYVRLPKFLYRLVPLHLILLVPLNKNKLAFIFKDVFNVHVPSSIFGLLYSKLAAHLKLCCPLTIGVYHSREFIWGAGGPIPYYERINRNLFFDGVPRRNLMFFNEKLVDLYWKGNEGADVNVFPLGVIESSGLAEKVDNNELVIGSIGRLVSFKTYNLWMIDVVKELKSQGIKVKYIVYGDGPLRLEMQKKINLYDLKNDIFLKGLLPYAEFSNAIKCFDVFVGSGTAIVEAASAGIPSIIGIESVGEALTYGYFSDIPGFSYHEDNLYPKVQVADVLAKFVNLNANQMLELRLKHVEKSNLFLMDNCVRNFEEMKLSSMDIEMAKKNSGCIFSLSYSLSYLLSTISCRLKGKTLSEKVYG